MTRSLVVLNDALDNISIASPCNMSWDAMVGSDAVRFCGACQKNVYNLSGMDRDSATRLVFAAEGRVCVRFFRRADGTVLTEDCPMGVALALKRAKRRAMGIAAACLSAVTVGLLWLGFSERVCPSMGRGLVEQKGAPAPALTTTMGKVKTQPAEIVMGEVAATPAPHQ